MTDEPEQDAKAPEAEAVAEAEAEAQTAPEAEAQAVAAPEAEAEAVAAAEAAPVAAADAVPAPADNVILGSGSADEPSDGVPDRRVIADRRRGKSERRNKAALVDANRRKGPTERRQNQRRRGKRGGSEPVAAVDPTLLPSASGTIPVRDSGVIDERPVAADASETARPARKRTEPPPPPPGPESAEPRRKPTEPPPTVAIAEAKAATDAPAVAERPRTVTQPSPAELRPPAEPVVDPVAVAEAKAASERLAAAEAERVAAAVHEAEQLASAEARRIAAAVASAESQRLAAAVVEVARQRPRDSDVIELTPKPSSEPPTAAAAATAAATATAPAAATTAATAAAAAPAAGAPARPPPPVTTPPHLLLGLASDTIPPPISAQPPPATPSTFDDGDDMTLDPIALATLALQRLRARARTDLASFRVQYQRLDGLVLVIASLIVFGAGFLHHRLEQPPMVHFKESGLEFDRTAAWLAPIPVPPIPPRLVRDPNPKRRDIEGPYHVAFTSSLGSNARLEVFIDQQPAWNNIVTGLELDRRTRFGELYSADPSAVRSIAGHDWLRTAYQYAYADRGDEPTVGHAVEYAAVDRAQMYVVTFFGMPAEIATMEATIAPTLQVESKTGAPLLPTVGRLGRRTFPAPVGSAFQSTVMVVVADLANGRLRASGAGSGVIVGDDGSILTNRHVVLDHDHEDRPHDVFVIGRFVGPDRPPALVCAGRPSRSKLQPELDLALIKCDMDLDGKAWTPARDPGDWPVPPTARLDRVSQGERLWVLGYPDVGGGGLTLSQGLVEGVEASGYLKTDAAITHGNSGGPVLDDDGKLIGIATAFRVTVTVTGDVMRTQSDGLVRPIAQASLLLAYAKAGWIPREGMTAVELEPPSVDATAEGIRISTTILDASNRAPIKDALLLVLKPGYDTSQVDMNRLDEQVLAWGKSTAQGTVRLKQLVPAPGTYSVMVIASGYYPLIGDNALHLGDKPNPSFDPWGEIRLESR